jgi:hypothetical protein
VPRSYNDVVAGGDAKHLLFVGRSTGYVLIERNGEPPQPGSEVELAEGEGTYVVAKIAASPLPGDPRRCAYLNSR